MNRPVLWLAVLMLASPALARTKAATTKPYRPSSAAFAYSFSTRDIQTVATGPLTVTAENGGVGPGFGYTPLRVHLHNSANQPFQVHLDFQSLSSAGSRSITRSLEVGPQERRTVVLPLPEGVSYGTLNVGSRGITDGGRKSMHFNPVSSPDERAMLALGEPSEFEDFIGESPDPVDPSVTVLPVPPGQAPEELAAYVGFDAVVIPNAALEELNEAQRRALEAYAATGGNLVLGNASRAVRTHLPLTTGDEEGRLEYGLGRVVVCREEPELCVSEIKTAHARTPVKPKGPPPAWMRRSRYYMDEDYEDDGGYGTMLLPQATAPVGWFLLIIMGFSVAIGPGSVLVARRRGTPALLISIPVTAAMTCAAIVGYSLIQDGFTVHAATRSVTLLDSNQHRAVTVGLGAFYANLAPEGARFSSSTALFAPSSRDFDGRSASIDWSQGVRFGADFIPSRTYREWGLVTVEPTRARLTVKQHGDGPPVVQNALGGRLGTVVFHLGNKVWRADGVSDGGEVQAREARNHSQSWSKEFNNRFDSEVLDRVGAPLRDGEFVARMEGLGPLPWGGVVVDLHSSEHVIRGRVER